MNQEARAPGVAILMGCYNGAAHLQEQLDSIAAQTYTDWVLLASDDGAGADDTRLILERFRDHIGADRITVRAGPGKGFLPNFLGMTCAPQHQARHYAYCDQDDVWEPEKLARAVACLDAVPSNVPAMYCTRTRLIDEGGQEVGYSPLFKRAPCFRNALVQSIGGGNTMVFNEAARQLLVAAGSAIEVASHDWWVYLLVSGAGGQVHYDPWASVRYRQHAANLVGGNVGTKARLRRLVKLLEGRYRSWNEMHCVALDRLAPLLTPEHREIFGLFKRSRRAGIMSRVAGVLKARVFRQTHIGNVGLYASVLLNKF